MVTHPADYDAPILVCEVSDPEHIHADARCWRTAEIDAPQPSTVALPAGGFCGGHPDCDDPRCRVIPPVVGQS